MLSPPSISLNRTRVELKHCPNAHSLVEFSGFESNQSGIETKSRRKIKGEQRAGLNRTRVELKQAVQSRTPATRSGFESNQSGIETDLPSRHIPHLQPGLNRTRVELKLSYVSLTKSSASGLNRTRVELKRIWERLSCVRVEQFESNQSGIETKPFLPPSFQNGFTFESNQSGIETTYQKRVGDVFYFVWIEPEWNWNEASGTSTNKRECVWIEPEWNWNAIQGSFFHSLGQFESNQSGIETSSSLPNTSHLRGLNRTRVELKHMLRSLGYVVEWVWIEPEWNWNRCTKTCNRARSRFESNQSGIETDWSW